MKILNKKIMLTAVLILLLLAGYLFYKRQYPPITFIADSPQTMLEFNNKVISLEPGRTTFRILKGSYEYKAKATVKGQNRNIGGTVNTEDGKSQNIYLSFGSFSEANIKNSLCAGNKTSCSYQSAEIKLTFVENDSWLVVRATKPGLETSNAALTWDNGSFKVVSSGTDLDFLGNNYPPEVIKLLQD